MNYPQYPLMYNPNLRIPKYVRETTSDKILSGISTGFIIGMIIIGIWVFWALIFYKWSSDRLGNLILTKYQLINVPPNSTSYFNYANVVLSSDKTSVTLDIQLKDKASQAVISSTPVTYKITSTCNDDDLTCISV